MKPTDIAKLDAYFNKHIPHMVHEPSGILKHKYITPSAVTDLHADRQKGIYAQQYDWDTFFIGLAWAQKKPELMNDFKDALLNFIDFTSAKGQTPKTLSPIKIFDPHEQHKPFLVQGILLACESLKDTNWVTDITWEKLEAYLDFWESRRGYHGLIRWLTTIESGVDNNATTVNLEDLRAESIDVSTYVYMEYCAMAELAKLTKRSGAEKWSEKATRLQEIINTAGWSEEHGCYFDMYNNVDQSTSPIDVVAWTTFVPLWAGICSQKQADRMIKNYILNEEHFMSPNGLRTLSKSDVLYNVAKRGNIYIHGENQRWTVSNWQGPVWVLNTWILTEGMKKYGHNQEAEQIKNTMMQTLLTDLETTGTLHENYDPERGTGLWSPNFGSFDFLAWLWV